MQVAKHFGASGSPRSLHSTSEAHRAVRRRRRWPNIEGGGAVSAGCVWKAQAYYNAKAAGARRATDSLTRSARSAGSGCLRAYARTRAGLRGPGSPSSRNLARVGHAFDQRARPLPWPSAPGPGSEPRAPGPGPRPRAPAPGRALGPGPGPWPRALGLALRRAPSGPPAGSFWPPGVWPSGGLLLALRRAPSGPQAPTEIHRYPKLFWFIWFSEVFRNIL